MCDSLPWTPMNHSAKFDAARFMLGGEIRKARKTLTQCFIRTSGRIICGRKRWVLSAMCNGERVTDAATVKVKMMNWT